MKIQRALISVSDKKGIKEFAKSLETLGIEIISTGGTARLLKDSGISVTMISEFTGFPEILGGRVKTLHPKVHGGLLGIRDDSLHQKQMKENDILPIDLVVVNLYPFEETIAREGVTLEEAIENIDIGGPSMLRSAAKNYRYVTVVVNPSKYDLVIDELNKNEGSLGDEFRLRLAREAFSLTSRYDEAIFNYLTNLTKPKGINFPTDLSLSFRKAEDLRYGENPHQKAAFYKERLIVEPCIANAKQIQGKALSFNNILDANAAVEIIQEFDDPTCIVIKHNNPCGAASDIDLFTAYKKAWDTDPISAFGSIISFNNPVTAHIAQELVKNFIEVIVAPSFTHEAIEIFSSKKNLRLLTIDGLGSRKPNHKSDYDLKKVSGGILIQQKDNQLYLEDLLKIVSKRQPTEDEMKSMIFAWKISKHVKSNAIVIAKDSETVGVGAGQMSRVDSSKIATLKAQKAIHGCVLASDAFFPFRDGIDVAHESGIKAIVQPGGSVKDQEVIDAANEHDMAMVFTGMRHFKH